MEDMQFEIDEYTELFELFGQNFFCSICQEEAQEGQRILEIIQCKHMFHEPCLEPWLRQKGTCPLCRVSIFGNRHREIAQRIRLLALLHIVEQQILTERRLLTWILCDGILQKFRNASEYQALRQRCEQVIPTFSLRTIHPLPIDFTNRTRIQKLAGQIRRQLLETYQERNNRLHTWTDVIMMRQYVSNHSVMNPEFQQVWQ